MTARIKQSGKTYTVTGEDGRAVKRGITNLDEAKDISDAYDLGFYTGGKIQLAAMKENAENLLKKLTDDL